MTSMATIAGALPPALAIGPGAELQRPMALAIVGGMVVSTLMTLLVVPAAYSLLDDGRRLEPRAPSARGRRARRPARPEGLVIPEGSTIAATGPGGDGAEPTGDLDREVGVRGLALTALPVLLLALGGGPLAAQSISPGVGRDRVAGAAVRSHPDVTATVARVIDSASHPWLTWSDIPDVAPVLRTLYATEPDGLFWFDGEQPRPAIADVVAGLALAREHGLSPADYDAEPVASAWARIRRTERTPPTDRALFDVALTVSVARLLSAVCLGRIDPATLHWGYDVTPRELDLATSLRDVRYGKGLRVALAELEPHFSHYARLRAALGRYAALAVAGEPPPAPELASGRNKVESGDAWNGVTALAARLVVLGDLSASDAAAGTARDAGGRPLFAGSLVDAVKRFQWRHGLEEDGVVGKGTIAALNVPLASRVRQLELALERERWLPAMVERPSVFVNVALFRLWASDPVTGEEPLRMNVVVGKSLHHRTPIFIEEMRYVIFRPYWSVPYSIAVRETVPRARKDPAYLEKNDFEIVAGGGEGAPALPATAENLDKVVAGTLQIRQKPGPDNSLGLAKFIFPNSESIYMHGTPAQQLFSRARRDFSHGCIRLENPVALAQWVLRDQPEWTRERIEAAMRGARPTRVNLSAPLDVVLFYVTSHVGSNGLLRFAEDIYGYDQTLDAALRQGYPYPRQKRGED